MVHRILGAAGVGLGAVGGFTARSLLRPDPAVALPPEVVEALLAELIAVDVERWRRFSGHIERSFAASGRSWHATFTRGDEWKPDDLSAWWRGGVDDVTPELTGTLVVADEAETAAPAKSYRMVASFTRTRSGTIDAGLSIAGRGRFDPIVSYERSAAAPLREGVDPPRSAGLVDTSERGRSWIGFPPPVAAIRPVAPLERLEGAYVSLNSFVDLAPHPSVSASEGQPDEFLLAACRSSTGTPDLLIRVTADGPLYDLFPESPDASWNRAEALDLEYRVTDLRLANDTLSLGGDKWAVEVSGDGLSVRVEQL